MGLRMGAYGLAVAQSTVAAVEVVLLFVLINRRIGNLFDFRFIRATLRMLLATAIMGVVAYVLVLLLPLQNADNSFFAALPKFMVISLGSFCGICGHFKVVAPQ